MATITYKCPNCDGGLLFDPSTQKYHCEYCQSSFSQEELDALAPAAASDTAVPAGMAAEGALGGEAAGGSAGAAPQTAEAFSGEAAREPEAASDGYAQDAAYQGDAMLYTCPSCGAEIVTDATTAATFCYYCHNPVVLSGRLTGTYQPDLRSPSKSIGSGRRRYFPSGLRKRSSCPGSSTPPSRLKP